MQPQDSYFIHILVHHLGAFWCSPSQRNLTLKILSIWLEFFTDPRVIFLTKQFGAQRRQKGDIVLTVTPSTNQRSVKEIVAILS